MDESFTPAELLTSEALVGELLRRSKIEASLLEKVSMAINNRTFDIFLFLWKYGPATRKQIEFEFSYGTTFRAIQQLEVFGVIKKKGIQYFIQK